MHLHDRNVQAIFHTFRSFVEDLLNVLKCDIYTRLAALAALLRGDTLFTPVRKGRKNKDNKAQNAF